MERFKEKVWLARPLPVVDEMTKPLFDRIKKSGLMQAKQDDSFYCTL